MLKSCKFFFFMFYELPFQGNVWLNTVDLSVIILKYPDVCNKDNMREIICSCLHCSSLGLDFMNRDALFMHVAFETSHSLRGLYETFDSCFIHSIPFLSRTWHFDIPFQHLSTYQLLCCCRIMLSTHTHVPNTCY